MGTDPSHSIFHFCRVHWEVRGRHWEPRRPFCYYTGWYFLPVRIALVLQVLDIPKAPLLVEFKFSLSYRAS